MTLDGYRQDGTLRIRIPGGVTILLQGDLASPPLDDTEADRLGPWIDPDTPLSWQERQDLAKRLDRSRVVPVTTFQLQFPFQKKKAAPAPAEQDAPAEEVAAPKADGESGGPAPASKPLTKGDLLARITEIARAQANAKDEAPEPEAKGPRSSLKRLKLEYEVNDSQGERQPVSDVAQPVPAHLKPMEERS